MEKVNLLLVDDEQDIIDLWKIHFKEERFSIFEATTGEAALKTITQIKDQPEQQLLIVLLDVKMPGLNGLEVLESIKQEIPYAKIFIITGNVEDSEIPDTAYFTGKLGGDGFYEKSKIDFDGLKKQINEFIEEEKAKLSKVKNIQKALEDLGAKVKVDVPYKI